MTYQEIQEVLIMSSKALNPQSYLEKEFPYKSSYEPMNLAILNAAKSGEKSISFDFIDNDMNDLEHKTIGEVEYEYRRIYPSYKSWTYALYNCFSYPRYLAARGFNVEITQSLKKHGYKSKSYKINW